MRKTNQSRLRQLTLFFRADRGGEFGSRGHASRSQVTRRSAQYYARVRRAGMLPSIQQVHA